MSQPSVLLFVLIFVTIFLIGVFVLRSSLTATRGGKIMAFLVLFVLPILCAAMGTSQHIENSKQRAFCLSCHTMEPYGKSLLVDDASYLAATHFQNHRVPPEQACYTCHTDYTLYGGLHSKVRGLRHLYIYYLSKPAQPIRLYSPYNNRECLHCHLGARSFEQGAVHNADPATLPAVKVNQLSCLSSGCHEIVHNVSKLNKAKFWKAAQ